MDVGFLQMSLIPTNIFSKYQKFWFTCIKKSYRNLIEILFQTIVFLNSSSSSYKALSSKIIILLHISKLT